MKSAKLIKQEIIDLITTKELSRNQLLDIYSVVKNIGDSNIEELRISDSVRMSSNGAFKGRQYFNNWMEKIVWEEED